VKRNAMRTFVLTRIEQAEQTGLSFDRPVEGGGGSMLHDAFGMMARKYGAMPQRVRLQFDAHAATGVRERQMA
jgi:hypothetical protein